MNFLRVFYWFVFAITCCPFGYLIYGINFCVTVSEFFVLQIQTQKHDTIFNTLYIENTFHTIQIIQIFHTNIQIIQMEVGVYTEIVITTTSEANVLLPAPQAD